MKGNHMNTETKRIERREAIRIIGAAGAAAVAAACGSETATSPSAVTTTTTGTGTGGTLATSGECAVSPNETAGPYPSTSDIFRSDIREDRAGVPLALAIRVINVSAGCVPLA